MPLQPGDRLGPYTIQALLGVGGMGEVYRGHDTRLGRDVALKVIAPKLAGDPSFRRRFELEARAASALNHPSIVTVYDVGDTEGVSWIAMEWLEGQTLRQALSGGPLPVRDAASIARQVAEGLAAAHAKGIVHRDLKPENVMIVADGRSKILDFGLARQTFADKLEGSMPGTVTALPGGATFEGAILGTVGYMSPEQASGHAADFRSDQFALGLIAYEMLAGRQAFARPTAVETLSAVIREEPPPLSSIRDGIPATFQGLIARCLAKHPDDRFASTRELATSLEFLGAGLTADSAAPTKVTGMTAVPERATSHTTRRAIFALGVALALALAAAGWIRFHPSGSAIQTLAMPPAIQTLAVLPFENTGQDAEIEDLGDGLTESLIDQMTRVPSLTVMARATVFHFKGARDPQAVGRELGVGAVLAGTVSRRGDRLVISAELIEVASGVRLWGHKYDRPIAELLHVQDSIASDITEGLRLRLSAPEKRTLGQHGTENPEAYELFLKARVLLSNDSEESDLEARRLYRQALEKDPKFVAAHLGIAATYARSVGEGYAPPAAEWAQALEEIKKAEALDPGNVLVRVALASRRFLFEWDWAGTEREFGELSTDPRLLQGIQFHGIAMFFWARGRPDEAVALMERALRVDPENLESRLMMGDFLGQAGRLDDAISCYRSIEAAEPSDPRPLFGLAEVLKRRGDVKGAIDALRKAYDLSGEKTGILALAAARTERDIERAEIAVARARLDDLQALAKERYVSPLDLGRLQALVGERDKAFASLEAAVAERSLGLVLLKVDRAWDRIRDDPRFAAIVRRVGIP